METPNMPNSRVLIVEDEFLIRLTLAEALSDEGFEVMEAATGDEALVTLLAERPDLLLTDIQLPGRMDGLALARRARENAPEMPVIFMTGRPDSMGTTSPAGRNVFIAKPYLPSEVCATARRLLGTDSVPGAD
jgi:DNA-binding response OmpR family regulator